MKAGARPAPGPLAELVLRLQAAREQDAGPDDDPEELRSARRVRRIWAHLRTQQQVRQAAAQLPANAGPLNSQVLVLQTLDLLGELSPDYLRRFIGQVEALQWLERTAPAAPAAPARRRAARR